MINLLKSIRKRMTKITRENILIIAFFGIVLVLLYLTLFPVKVYDRVVEKFDVENTTVRAGEDVVYVEEFCKIEKSPTRSIANLVNGSIYTVSIVENNFEPGCYKFRQHLTIPTSAEPGIYYITVIKSNKINLFRTQTESFLTETFEVVEAMEDN